MHIMHPASSNVSAPTAVPNGVASGQLVHDATPVEGLYEPASQGLQELKKRADEGGLYLPAWQSEQLEGPSLC